jgi:hypothetical protein
VTPADRPADCGDGARAQLLPLGVGQRLQVNLDHRHGLALLACGPAPPRLALGKRSYVDAGSPGTYSGDGSPASWVCGPGSSRTTAEIVCDRRAADLVDDLRQVANELVAQQAST